MARAKADKVPRSFKARSSSSGVTKTGYTRGGGATWSISTTLAPSFDAAALADHISDVVMAEHWHAIGEGRRADGYTKQPPLAAWGQAGQDAAEGKRPNIRGLTADTSKPFRDNIERTAIKISGRSLNRSRVKVGNQFQGKFRFNETVESTRARTTIQPDRIHASFMGLEYDKRGNQWFFVKGLVAEAVDKALAAFTGLALEGVVAKADKRERLAGNAKTRTGSMRGPAVKGGTVKGTNKAPKLGV